MNGFSSVLHVLDMYVYTIYIIILKEKSTFHLSFYAASTRIKTPFILNFFTRCLKFIFPLLLLLSCQVKVVSEMKSLSEAEWK